MTNQLTRPRAGRMLGGVAAGIADRYGWNRGTVRLALVVSCLLPGPQLVAYAIAWAVIPDESTVPTVLVS